MTDGEDRIGDSATRTDAEAPPSLSELAKRIKRRGERPDRESTDDRVPPESGNDRSPVDPDPAAESEFFFPRTGSRDGDTPAEAATPTVQEQADRASRERDDATPRDPDPARGGGSAGKREEPGGGRADGSDGGLGNDAKAEAIIELLGDVRNVLLLGPLSSPAEYNLCMSLLVPGDDAPENLLLVTFDESPDDRLNVLRGHLASLPDRIGILNVGDPTRSGSSNLVSTTGTEGISIRNIGDPTDIQRIGLAINKYLSEWEGEGDTAVCFHSLTDLLGTVDSESAFRFLNVLLGRVRSGEIRAHYHMDPGAHDDQTLGTYQPLFDETIRVEEDGTVTIDR